MAYTRTTDPVHDASYHDRFMFYFQIPQQLGSIFSSCTITLVHIVHIQHRLVQTFLETDQYFATTYARMSILLNIYGSQWDKDFSITRHLQPRERLFNCISDLWNTTNQMKIDNLIFSMPNRCLALMHGDNALDIA